MIMFYYLTGAADTSHPRSCIHPGAIISQRACMGKRCEMSASAEEITPWRGEGGSIENRPRDKALQL